MSIIGGVLDIGGHNKSFVGPVPFVGAVEGVYDVDVVKEGMVGDIVNKSQRQDRRLVFFVGLFWVLIIDLGVLVVVVLSHGQCVAT